jgi:hypothetical protein
MEIDDAPIGPQREALGPVLGGVFVPVQLTHMGFTAVQSNCYSMPFNFPSNVCGVKGVIHYAKCQ